MKTKFAELICDNAPAKFILSVCNDERGPIATFMYDWQTFLSGLLAVLAAFIGGYLLWLQIQDQRAESKKRARAENLAARIRIPHALSELNTYWSACFDAWLKESPEDRPERPVNAIEVIMAAAPAVDDESFESIQKLVELSQAFESRLDHKGPVRPINILDNMIADIADLTYLTNRLYEFGRMEVDNIPYKKSTRADLEDILRTNFGLRYIQEVDPVHERIQRALKMRFPRSASATET